MQKPRNRFLFTLILVLGVLLGQESIKRAYNPTYLEQNFLDSITDVYRLGCRKGNKDWGFCDKEAEKFKKSYEEVFHHKAWKKYP